MDINEFREFGRAAIDFLADYLENIRDRLEKSSKKVTKRGYKVVLWKNSH